MSFRVCFAAMVASVLCLPGQAHALQSQCLTLPRDALGPPDPGQVTDEIPVHLAVAPAAQAEAASLFVVTQSFNWPASPSFNNSAAVQGGDPVDEWNHAPSGPITGDDEYLIYIAPEDTTPGLVAITADSER